MGKSPAKWIKSLLSRKKSSRSHGSKKREASGKGNSTPDSPVISQPLPVNASRNDTPVEILALSSTTTNGVIPSTNDQDPVIVASAGTATEEEIREENAVVKVQSAFRGFLARRAFHALHGIIRLQALIRGHLVRRQAIATLRCMHAILKLQALARGRKIDSSRSLQKMKFSSNTFVRKLRSSYPVAMPLKIQYHKYDSNSSWNWLERWTYSQLWKPPVQIKKSVVQTESSRSKRTTRRNPYASNSESGSSSIIATKRNFKKLVGSSVDPVQEQPPLSELEKVKYNLRKISNSVAQSDCTADVPENESTTDFTEKIKNNENTALTSDAPVTIPPNEATLETSIKTLPDIKVNMDSVREQVEADMVANGVNDGYVSELQSLNGFVEDKDVNSLIVETTPYKEQASQENQKSSKRRASLTANLDCHEDDLNNTPTLPSYMAATKSARAKLRGLTSPRISSDGIEKNGFARRHSLPSLTNKKLSPLTSQTQKRGQTNGRMGVRNDMPIQVEWRR